MDMIVNKPFVDSPADLYSAFILIQDDIYNIVPCPGTRLSQKGFLIEIMPVSPPVAPAFHCVKIIIGLHAIRYITSKGPRSRHNIFLGIIIHTQRKQFHQLSGKIFIGCLFSTAVDVQPNHHGWTKSNPTQKILKISQAIGAEYMILLIHGLGIKDLGIG